VPGLTVVGAYPKLRVQIIKILERINGEEGVALLIVKQKANLALDFAECGYLMENGEVVLDGMEKIHGRELGGLLAPMSYGPDRRQGTRACRIVKADLQNNRWIPVSDWQEPSFKVRKE
jgi:branched-chain amino acid transport system ATP-binding protein